MPPLKPEKPKREFSWSKLSKTVSFWILVILIPFVMLQALGARDNAERDIKYNPTFKDHHFWALDIGSVMAAGGITNRRQITEDITVGYYSNAQVTLSDGQKMSLKAMAAPA